MISKQKLNNEIIKNIKQLLEDLQILGSYKENIFKKIQCSHNIVKIFALTWSHPLLGRGEPCVFNILPIGPPEPPAKCRTSNVTYSSFEVRSTLPKYTLGEGFS